jgi:NTP pyrophosphatase (non-canonical NTP hydrolase)
MRSDIQETLLITQEECSEVTQAISKVFRFGFDSEHQGKTNKEMMEEEIGDLLCMIDLLVEKCVISDEKVNQARKNKREKLKKWSKVLENDNTCIDTGVQG